MHLVPSCFPLLLLILPELGRAKECYVTDIRNLGRSKRGFTIEDCKDNIRRALRIQGLNEADPPSHLSFNCYTVFINIEVANIRLKGCIPEGGCPNLIEGIKYRTYWQRPNIKIKNISCVECSEEWCNSDEERPPYMKLKSSGHRKTFHFGAGLFSFMLFLSKTTIL